MGKGSKVFRGGGVSPVLPSALQPTVLGCPLKGKAVVKKLQKRWTAEMACLPVKKAWNRLAFPPHSISALHRQAQILCVHSGTLDLSLGILTDTCKKLRHFATSLGDLILKFEVRIVENGLG